MHKRTKLSGFIIVELLIVVVIAVLAAISIVVYTNTNNQAHTSAAGSEASQVAKKMQRYYAGDGNYPTSLAEAGVADTDTLQYAYSNTTSPKTFCVTKTLGTKSMKADTVPYRPQSRLVVRGMGRVVWQVLRT